MRVKIFGFDADPLTDSPIVHKSKSYAAELVRSGRAFMLNEHSIKLNTPPEIARDRENKSGSMADWFTSQMSVTPTGFLRVTTRQLDA